MYQCRQQRPICHSQFVLRDKCRRRCHRWRLPNILDWASLFYRRRCWATVKLLEAIINWAVVKDLSLQCWRPSLTFVFLFQWHLYFRCVLNLLTCFAGLSCDSESKFGCLFIFLIYFIFLPDALLHHLKASTGHHCTCSPQRRTVGSLRTVCLSGKHRGGGEGQGWVNCVVASLKPCE